MSDTATNVGLWIGEKRKRQDRQQSDLRVSKHLDSLKPTFFLRTFVAEFDKIMEERLPSNQRSLKYKGRHWWQRNMSKSAFLQRHWTLAEDVLSDLPDEILCYILSFMSLREAATTSILSRRWRNLWKTTCNLHFDTMNLTGDHMGVEEFQRKGETNRLHQNRNFVSWVNKILKVHTGSKIESFAVEFPLGSDYINDVVRWIQFAAEKQVEKLTIKLAKGHLLELSDQCPVFVKFPHQLFNLVGKRPHLRHLSLSHCLLKLPANCIGFTSLVSLSLRNTYIKKEYVTHILASCSNLEWLSLRHCMCPVRLKFAAPGCSQLNLKHLNVDGCFNLKEVEIFAAVKLVSFEYDGSLRTVSFENSAQPVRVCYRGTTKPLSHAITYVLGGLAQKFTFNQDFDVHLSNY